MGILIFDIAVIGESDFAQSAANAVVNGLIQIVPGTSIPETSTPEPSIDEGNHGSIDEIPVRIPKLPL